MSATLRSIAGRSIFRLSQRGLRLAHGLRASLPRVFGLPVRATLVQLYREDDEFSTVLSFANYVSLFAPRSHVGIRLTVRAWDRSGRRLGRGLVRIAPSGSVQMPLTEAVGARLDAHGMFAVDADYEPRFDPQASFLRETSPQFMTLFTPRASRASPQMLHSHKELDRIPVPFSPNSQRSFMISSLAGLRRLDLFVLNSGSRRLRGRIAFSDCADDHACGDYRFDIPGRGVQRLGVDPAELAHGSGLVGLRLDFDRLTSHRKPILFRTYADGTVVSNHT